MATVGEAFELHVLGRQVRGDLLRADDRAHRVVLATEHQHRTLCAGEVVTVQAALDAADVAPESVDAS